MGLLTTCPVPSEITDIAVPTCFADFGQITKLILQRKFSSGTTLNSIVIATTNPNVLATWTTLLGASDGTKVQATPQINNSDLVSGDPEEFGGGDATVGGATKIMAQNPASFTGEIHQYATRQDIIAALKTYQGENAGVYLVNEHGQIGCLGDTVVSPTTVYPIPFLQGTFFVSDLQGGKRNSPDMNMIRFQLAPNWSDRFYIVNPTDFNGNDLA